MSLITFYVIVYTRLHQLTCVLSSRWQSRQLSLIHAVISCCQKCVGRPWLQDG